MGLLFVGEAAYEITTSKFMISQVSENRKKVNCEDSETIVKCDGLKISRREL